MCIRDRIGGAYGENHQMLIQKKRFLPKKCGGAGHLSSIQPASKYDGIMVY